jgi:hypothetical protein
LHCIIFLYNISNTVFRQRRHADLSWADTCHGINWERGHLVLSYCGKDIARNITWVGRSEKKRYKCQLPERS